MSKLTLAQAVAAALEELPAEQQRAFALMVLHGLPIKQVAARAGSSFEELQHEVTTTLLHLRTRLEESGYGVWDLS